MPQRMRQPFNRLTERRALSCLLCADVKPDPILQCARLRGQDRLKSSKRGLSGLISARRKFDRTTAVSGAPGATPIGAGSTLFADSIAPTAVMCMKRLRRSRDEAAGTSIQAEAVAHGMETSPKSCATPCDAMVGGIGFVTLPHAP